MNSFCHHLSIDLFFFSIFNLIGQARLEEQSRSRTDAETVEPFEGPMYFNIVDENPLSWKSYLYLLGMQTSSFTFRYTILLSESIGIGSKNYFHISTATA